jgi:uncharacterized protein GlcG (DUF336 family)
MLGLTDAQAIAERAVADASRLGLRISVAVTDEAGAPLAFARMNGATGYPPGRPSTRRRPSS